MPLIIYAVLATVVLVFCTISRVRPRVEYIGISVETLNDLTRSRDDLVVVDLREAGYQAIPNSLRVPVEELKGFLQSVPEHSTLVLCGLQEVAFCRDAIEMTLFGRGLQFVFVVDVDDDPSKAPLARHGSRSRPCT